ncbi:hypothetical protein, partial [Enteroscipio rubneri]|uniref:hypothetical protein n=1 Tax=Enteroscipio rubneri TaxID=2070686 RepID=UPI003AB7F999
GDAEDFHIARASPSIRAVSRMDVLLPAIIGQRARRRMRYPHSAKEDLHAFLKAGNREYAESDQKSTISKIEDGSAMIDEW